MLAGRRGALLSSAHKLARTGPHGPSMGCHAPALRCPEPPRASGARDAGNWSHDGDTTAPHHRTRGGSRTRQLLDHHLRLPDEQGGFRAHGRDPGSNGLPGRPRRAQRRSGALQHLHDPRQRRAEGLQLPRAPGATEAHQPQPHPGGGGLRGPAGGGIPAAAGAGAGSGDGPPARQPARCAAGPGGAGPAGGSHRGAPHP